MAGSFNPLWQNPPVPTQDLGGDLVTDRGGDPLIDTGGTSGLIDFWTKEQIVEVPPDKETPNPVSGLPTTPARWEPSDNPPPPPDLTDRNPGTIDQK
jgi:hypothetical protein